MQVVNNISTIWCLFKWINQYWWINQLAIQLTQRRLRERQGKDNNNSRREQYSAWLFQGIWKKKKTLLQRVLQHVLEIMVFQRTAKFVEMKGIVILVKVDEMCNILKRLLATRYWSRDESENGWSKFFDGAFTTQEQRDLNPQPLSS